VGELALVLHAVNFIPFAVVGLFLLHGSLSLGRSQADGPALVSASSPSRQTG
jgi:hypothetical protein